MARTRSTVTAATVLALAAVTAVWASVSLAAQQDAPADPVDSFARTTDDQAARQAPRLSDTTTGGSERSRTQPPVPRPERVLVPSLGVAAPVVATGVTPRGDAQIPRDGDVVGWYQFGARPGDTAGSAVLIGHRDTDEEGPGALFDLDGVQAGDPVVVRAGTQALRYEVVALRSIDKAALPDALFRRTGQPRLVLITCGGPYVPEAGGYQENVVVVAQPLDSESRGSER